MSKLSRKYKVRVVHLDSRGNREEICSDGFTRSEALAWFIYYVRSAVELNVSIETVNIFLGKKCLYLYTKH